MKKLIFLLIPIITYGQSFDNFSNQHVAGTLSSYVRVIPSNGKILYEHKTVDGKCYECYDELTRLADSCYSKKNYRDAETFYSAAFELNGDKGKVKHRLNAACSQVKNNNFEGAFENLNRIVFVGKLKIADEINCKCFKPLKKDSRYQDLLDGVERNLLEVQQKIKVN